MEFNQDISSSKHKITDFTKIKTGSGNIDSALTFSLVLSLSGILEDTLEPTFSMWKFREFISPVKDVSFFFL